MKRLIHKGGLFKRESFKWIHVISSRFSKYFLDTGTPGLPTEMFLPSLKSSIFGRTRARVQGREGQKAIPDDFMEGILFISLCFLLSELCINDEFSKKSSSVQATVIEQNEVCLVIYAILSMQLEELSGDGPRCTPRHQHSPCKAKHQYSPQRNIFVTSE